MRRETLYAYLILLFFYCSTVDAAESKVSLKPGKIVDLPAAGIRFHPFESFSQSAIPSIPVYSYNNRSIEAYAPADLWRRDQQIGRYKGENGYFELAALNYLMPQKLPLINNVHVVESDYYQVLDKIKTEWNEEKIRTWVEMFAGKVDSKKKNIRGLYLRYNYSRFTFEGLTHEEKQAFVIGDPNGNKTLFLFRFEKGLNRSVVDKAIWSLLKTVMITGKRNVITNKGRRFQNYRTNVREKKSPRFEATRKRVVDEIENLKGWWYVKTKNYVIKSNLTYEDRALALLIQNDIEIMRKVYTAFFPPVKEIDEVSVVTVFKSRKEYQQYIPADFSWSIGMWMPARKELVISPDYIGDRKMSNKEMLSTVYHEAFHQYCFYAIGYVTPPMWYNEGYAALFEACKIDRSRKTIVIRENDRRMKVVESLIKNNRIKLEKTMSLLPDEFYQKDDLDENYAVSWALVYFFCKAGHMYKDRNYEKICDIILQTLIKTRDRQKADAAGMAAISMEEFEKDFIDFWTSTSKRRIAAGYRLFDNQGNRVK